jgi:iodotyrosine deiodinase
MNNFIFVPLEYQELDEEEMLARSSEFLERMEQRRSVRQFSSRSVPWEIIENCLRAAATAPSGANMQPWHYVVVSDSELKLRIRMAAEEEEREFYANRAPQEWLDALAPLGTDADKPFLESAPYLIVIFAKSYTISPQGKKVKNYYVSESVGIATGILITALHQSGLATLTHTPSPMRFLNQILNRPQNEHPFLILVVGYPAEDAEVPKINKKPFNEINTLI